MAISPIVAGGINASNGRSYYGAVGNGETLALIGPDLAVDWLCLPRFDGFPVFGRALDPQRGGALILRWGKGDVPQPEEQYYIGKTNILVTAARSDGLLVRSVDYMPWDSQHLTRVITVINPGKQPREAELEVVATPTHSVVGPELTMGEVEGKGPRLIRSDEATLAYGFRGSAGPGTRVRLKLGPGRSRRLVLIVAYGRTAEEALANWRQARTRDLLDEQRFWKEWLSQAVRPNLPERDLQEAYWRSLLTIKLLSHRETGAILAAPTASFPAVPGGYDNWDYRYCWLRDGYMCARTLDGAGMHAEARAFYEFAFQTQGADGHWSYPLYTLDGGRPAELVAPDLAGPGGEQPVRLGNAAWDQLQLDSEPSILLGLWTHILTTRDWAYLRSRWAQVTAAAEAIMRLWREPENGIWEIRERRDHWLYGKSLCAAGLLAAAEMADSMGDWDAAARWRAEANVIRDEVVTRGWNEGRQAYLQTYTPESPLDISALAVGLWGLIALDDRRLTATVATMERPLRRPEGPPTHSGTDTPFWGEGRREAGLNMDGGIARYDYAAVPFYLPTLWLGRYYLQSGNRERALELTRTCLRSATSLGLMAEHFDPVSGEQWGNFPQAFNHAELVAVILEMARVRKFVPPLAPGTWTWQQVEAG